MKEYTEILKDYLGERRNISKGLYKFMNTAFRLVEKERTTWDYIIEITGGKNNGI